MSPIPLFSKGRLAVADVVGKGADKILTQAHIVVVQAVPLRKDSLETWASDHLAGQMVTVEGVIRSQSNRLSDSDLAILTSNGLSLSADYIVVEAGEQPLSIWTSIIAFMASISTLGVMLYMGSRSIFDKRSEPVDYGPPIPPQPLCEPLLRSFLEGFIKVSGRMPRGRYALSLFAAIAMFLLLLMLLASSGGVVFGLLFVLSRIPIICLHIQRLHDVNYSGWYVLYSLIGLDTIVLIPYLLLKSGNPEMNRYGPPTSFRLAAHEEQRAR